MFSIAGRPQVPRICTLSVFIFEVHSFIETLFG